MLEPESARAAELAFLRQLVTTNAETDFGEEHGFGSIQDVDAYRRAVPIRTYDELEPWIERAASGEDKVLTAERPIRFWKTTGTTSKAKKIPITPAAAARVTESFIVLAGTQYHYYPELNQRADTILFAHLSPRPVKEYLAGVPFCSNSEAPVEVRPGQEEFVAPWMVPLQAVAEDDAERLYFVLCFTALHDLLAICCLHPSRFQTIVKTLDTSWPQLVKELRDGTILGKKMREPSPDRAKALEACASKSGRLLPIDIWPNLKFIGSWSGSYLARYRPVMELAFSKSFLAMPSMSSECFMTMTIDEDRLGHPLNLRAGLYEFVPAGTTMEPHTPTLRFYELVQGESYEMIISTLGGLYRYALADIFRVTGAAGGVPRLEYVGRRAVSDLTGEKLAEQQVAEVVGAVFSELGVVPCPFTLCGIQEDGKGSRAHYVLVLESDEPLDDAKRGALARAADEGLKAANPRYELKRNFGDLDSLVLRVVPNGTFAAYRDLLASRGMPAGQIKDKILHPIGGPVLADLSMLSVEA